jgi:biotin carboxyl carrier protein
VIEAMKMEIPIESDEAGTVKEVLVSQGSPVAAGQAVIILELEEA